MEPMMLVRASLALPQARGNAADWARRAGAMWADPQVGLYRGLTAIMFEQTGCDPATACRAAAAHEGGRFLEAQEQTQHELADAAVRGLLEQTAREQRSRCKLAMYGTSSVDEHLFQSTISRLAADHGFAELQHWGLAQLQGATLPAAAEIAQAMLGEGDDAALFVAADRWPLPAPRLWDGFAPLGDAAAALWFERGATAGLQYLGGRQDSFAPFVRSEGRPGGALRFERDALAVAAQRTIEACLAAQACDGDQLSVWIDSGLGAAFDAELRAQLGVRRASVVAAEPDEGYLGAAAGPVLLARALEASLAGRWPRGARMLVWGASMGGAVGAALWRSCVPKEH